MNEQQIKGEFFEGSLGKGGNSLNSFFEISEDLIIFLQKIEQLKVKQSDYEIFKNINGKWKRGISTFFPFATGVRKPNVSLIFKEAFSKERNEVVIGESGNGKAYHPRLVKI
ncbi:hypothetical protein PVA17_20230 [Lysinibacillus sp. CNPSo 3705]|uniref:hypothetical protein n=1 Tax=Lysinibacillus sp. CNPSo 3705 TaxID=3028148 RepID=UPI0023634E13|nr:hypothetical protein [Lysinibacillus sp. CNPSo 3705]MDD1505073.1 hypothetical protein [Lysinibacillus sp. CNPSo 3705]